MAVLAGSIMAIMAYVSLTAKAITLVFDRSSVPVHNRLFLTGVFCWGFLSLSSHNKGRGIREESQKWTRNPDMKFSIHGLRLLRNSIKETGVGLSSEG